MDQGAEQGGETAAVGTASRVDQPLPQTAPPCAQPSKTQGDPGAQMGPQHVLNPEPKGCGLLHSPYQVEGPLVGRVQSTLAFDQGQAPRSQSPFPGAQHGLRNTSSPLLGQQGQGLPVGSQSGVCGALPLFPPGADSFSNRLLGSLLQVFPAILGVLPGLGGATDRADIMVMMPVGRKEPGTLGQTFRGTSTSC